MITVSEYTPCISRYAFKCPYCDTKVFAGDACLDAEKGKTCINHLPERWLIPKAEYDKRIGENKSSTVVLLEK
jgi:hypothetical protein